MLILTPSAVESAWEAICLLVERSYQEYGVRYVCIDTETEPKDGASPDDALIYGRAFLKVTSLAVFGQSFSFPTNRLSPSYPTSIYWRDHLLKKIWAKAATAGWVVVCHNSNYDLNIFYAELGMPTPKKIWCTMIGAWAASPYIEKGLKSRAYRYGRVLTETKHIDFSNLRKLADYAEQDVIQTEELFLAQNNIPFKRPPAIFPLVHKKGSYGKFRVDQLLVDAETLLLPENPIIPADEKLTEASSNWVSRVELPVLRSTMRAERRGFPFIVNRLRSIREKVNEDKKACLKTIYQLAGEKVNIGSNPQMSAIFRKLGIQNPYKTKKSGKQSFDAKSMHLIGLATGHPFVAAVVKLTGLKKMASVYTGDRDYDPEEHNEDCGLEYYYNPDTGCIHCSLATVGAVTGRSSCCVSGDTLLPTNRGTFRFDEYLPQEGDTVISHLRRECRVLSKVYKGRAPMFRFTLSNGARLKATGRHIVFCEGFEERMLATLTVGDRVLSYECKHDKSPVGEISGASPSEVSYSRTKDFISNRGGVRNEPRDCLCGLEDSAHTRTIYGGEAQAVLRNESWGPKPHEGQEWFPASQLYWGNRGRPRLSPKESLREVSACPSVGSPESRRSEAYAEGLCSSPYRWKQKEQQFEQSVPSEFRRAQASSLFPAEIVQIEALGIQDVWDIQVEGDHSYLAENFVNHNSNPNLQQIPSRKDSYALKRAFGFEDDDDYSLIVLDHSQLELRVMAALCRDPKMCEILRDRKGDLHQFTADMFGVPRDPDAKQLNFLLLYGGQAKMMASQLTFSGSPTSEVQCQQYIRRHTEVYPRVSEYRKELLMEHQKCGHTTLLLQRHRHLPGINWNDSHSVHKAETTLSNNVVQGCLLGSTRLLLDSGEETEIQSLRRRYELGKRGQKIWSGNSWETVTDVFSVGKKPLWKVKLSDGTTFQTSDTHLWKNELGEWVKTANLAKGDFIQQSLKAQTRALPCAYSPDYAEFVGMMVGDGSYCGTDICLVCKKEPDIRAMEESLLAKLFGDDGYTIQGVKSKARFYVRQSYGHSLRESGLCIGHKNSDKQIPDWVLSASVDHREAFIRGYYLTDGGTSVRNVAFSSVSKPLLQKTKRLLASLGIGSNLRLASPATATTQDYWRLSISVLDKPKFASLFSGVECKKIRRLRKACSVSKTQKGDGLPPRLARRIAGEWDWKASTGKGGSQTALYFRINAMHKKLQKGKGSIEYAKTLPISEETKGLLDYSFLQVVSVEDCRKQVEMFDLTVEPSHQYAAWNGAIMHNSGQDLLKAGIIRLDYSCYNPDSSILEAGIGHRRHREVCTYYARKLEKYRKVLRSGKCKYLLQVHDELVFRVKREAAEECARICAEVMSWESFMPSVYDFSNKSYPVPFVAEGGVAQNWKDAKSKDKARFHVKVGYDTWEKFSAV